MDTTRDVFFVLLRAGIWEKDVRLQPFGEVNYSALYQLAEEQAVVGLIAAGVEHVIDKKPSPKEVKHFIYHVIQLEQQNIAMNSFISAMVDKLREAEIDPVLIKGQGVAQCYERPLWRSCGDVDFFLNDEGYQKAKKSLSSLASKVEKEYVREKHLGMTIGPWAIELHGSLYSGLSSKIEHELDGVYQDSFVNRNIRFWKNGDTQVSLLAVENDVFYVFTHLLQHFYKGGIGLRQICDWCRMLLTYRERLNVALLEQRLSRARLMTAWRAFGMFAVEYLGMSTDVMPFLDAGCKNSDGRHMNGSKLRRKADRIKDFVMMTGNFGHNRDYSYLEKYPYIVRKCISFSRRVSDLFCLARIFPLDVMRFYPSMLKNGVRSVMRGE